MKSMIIEAMNITFGYGSTQILRSVNIHAEKGQIISLLGPNGSGKSTLLRCLCGLLPVAKQTVFIHGKPIETYHSRELARTIAFLPQSQERMALTSVYELVSMGRAPYHRSGWLATAEDKRKIQWAMDYMQISAMKDRMVETLSGGERQRVWIAMILAQDTPIILLDEPVTYMDLKHQWNLLEIIRDLKKTCGKTIISVFHDINHAMEISDMVCMLKDGKVYSIGMCDQVINERGIHDVFEMSVNVCYVKECRKHVVVPTRVKYLQAALSSTDTTKRGYLYD